MVRPWMMMAAIFFSRILLPTTALVFHPWSMQTPSPAIAGRGFANAARLSCNENIDGSNENIDGSNATFPLSLAERIAAVEASEAANFQRLQSRLDDVRAADEAEAALGQYATLPVVCLDALLPGQRMELNTDDPAFCALLRSCGLGGLFVLSSLHPKQRRVRRHACLVRITLVDAARATSGAPLPTAVRATLVGRMRALVLGPNTQRLGCWRRQYDPEGEQACLGWGPEPLVIDEWGVSDDQGGGGTSEQATVDDVPTCRVRLLRDEESVERTDASGGDTAETDDDGVAAARERVLRLLDEWSALVRDASTFDNVNVVAAARAQKGEGGLRVDPSKLLNGVLSDLGPRPEAPTALAIWIAALINPMPTALGVAPECRASVLVAPNARVRLGVVEGALKRSLANLRGDVPL